MKIIKRVSIKRENLIAKVITKKEDFIKAYRLRHEVYCRELQWIQQSSTNLEIDRYDKKSIFLGVFDNKKRIISFARIKQYEFMIDCEFDNLIYEKEKIIRSASSAEVSRLCIHPSIRNNKTKVIQQKTRIADLTFELITLFCKKNNIRHIYFVVDILTHRLISSKGYPVKKLSKIHKTPEKCNILLSTIDFNQHNRINSTFKSRKELHRYSHCHQMNPVKNIEFIH